MAIERRQFSIVGSVFYPGADGIIKSLKRGQPLTAVREPTNKYDKNAIAIHYLNTKLGHVPRGFAAELSPLIDAGGTLKVTASRNFRFDGTGVMVAEWENGVPDAPPAE